MFVFFGVVFFVLFLLRFVILCLICFVRFSFGHVVLCF